MGTGCCLHWGPWFSGAAGRELGWKLVDWRGAGPERLLPWPGSGGRGPWGWLLGLRGRALVRGTPCSHSEQVENVLAFWSRNAVSRSTDHRSG